MKDDRICLRLVVLGECLLVSDKNPPNSIRHFMLIEGTPALRQTSQSPSSAIQHKDPHLCYQYTANPHATPQLYSHSLLRYKIIGSIIPFLSCSINSLLLLAAAGSTDILTSCQTYTDRPMRNHVFCWLQM